jgi:hypothetical protein
MRPPVDQGSARSTQSMVVLRLDELESALWEEGALIENLRDTLLGQREGVAPDNPEAIEMAVHALSRSLLTLGEAYRRRTALITLVIGTPGIALDDLQRHLGVPLPAGLVEACERVQHAAEAFAVEVAINRNIQSRAREAGEAFRQQLFSGAPASLQVRAQGPKFNSP